MLLIQCTKFTRARRTNYRKKSNGLFYIVCFTMTFTGLLTLYKQITIALVSLWAVRVRWKFVRIVICAKKVYFWVKRWYSLHANNTFPLNVLNMLNVFSIQRWGIRTCVNKKKANWTRWAWVRVRMS